jgi:hypothetical protein
MHRYLVLQKSCGIENGSLYPHISCAHIGFFLLDTSRGPSLQPTYIRINYHMYRVHTLTLKMEATRSSETLVFTDKIIRLHNPKDLCLNLYYSHHTIYYRVLIEVKIFPSHATHVHYVYIFSSDQKLSFRNILYCFKISAIVLWYQFQYQFQILLKIILITLCYLEDLLYTVLWNVYIQDCIVECGCY